MSEISDISINSYLQEEGKYEDGIQKEKKYELQKIISVLELEEKRFFIYLTDSSYDNSRIMRECEIYYDFVKKYKPLNIIEQYIIQDEFQVINIIKKYMFLYGYEYVRGGPYLEETLTSEQYKVIDLEMEYFENDDIHGYSFEEVLSYEYREYNSVEEIDQEISKINNIYNKYLFEKTRLFNIRSSFKKYNDLNTVSIEKMNSNDMLWLYEICEINYNRLKNSTEIMKKYNKNNPNAYYLCNYRNIIKNIKILNILSKTTDFFPNYSLQIEEYKIYLKYPEFLFDTYIYDNKIGNSLETISKFCNFIKGMIDTVQNRIDEYKFDLLTYTKDIEWKTPRILYILEKKKQDIQESLINNKGCTI